MSYALVDRANSNIAIRHSAIPWPRILLVGNLIGLLAIAIGLRVWQLSNLPGLNGDEAWSGVQAVHLAQGQAIAWRTPTGNLINPFFLGPLAALHVFFEPSVTLLRLPALLSGVAALVVNFFLCRRVFDRTSAWVSTLLLAVLPLNIAYSRFAWDSSQSLLATLLVVYFALEMIEDVSIRRRTLLPAMLAYCAAILVHPTNVFVGWMLFVGFAFAFRAELTIAWQAVKDRRSLRILGFSIVLGISAVASWFPWSFASTVLGRAFNLAQFGQFLRLFVRMFSGSTVLEFIPGPAKESTALDAIDVAFCSVLFAAAAGLFQILRSPNALRDRALAIGTLLMVLSFYLVAGPTAIIPHFERYGVCLIAPGAVLMARGLARLLAAEKPQRRLTISFISALAWLWLAMFTMRYFLVIEASGGKSHVAFQTAQQEPKQSAWELIARESGDTKNITIISDCWWSYWPLAYFSTNRPGSHVIHWDQLPEESTSITPDALWLVEFCDTPEERSINGRLEQLGLTGRKTVICDFSGKPLLAVVRATEKSAKNN